MVENTVMPFLERNTSTIEACGRKYVYWNGKIFFSNTYDESVNHSDLVREAANAQGLGLQDIKRNELTGKPFVEAAGKIEVIDGKFSFGVMTSTCKVIYPNEKAAQKVADFARGVVGNDKVF